MKPKQCSKILFFSANEVFNIFFTADFILTRKSHCKFFLNCKVSAYIGTWAPMMGITVKKNKFHRLKYFKTSIVIQKHKMFIYTYKYYRCFMSTRKGICEHK